MHELGVRATLGAGRDRLIRQLLTESLLLGVGGGVAGIGLAWVFLRVLLLLDPGDIPRLHEASLNGKVLAFAVAITLLTSVLTGTLPALSASRANLIGFLKSGGQTGARGSRNRIRSALVMGEVAIVVVLLAGAGLLVRSFIKLQQVPVGFSSTTLSMKIELPETYGKPEQRHAFYQTLLSQIEALQGTVATGAIENLPLGGSKGGSLFRVEDHPSQEGQMLDGADVTPGYFSAMDIPLIEGRFFTEEDVSGYQKVVIVNQTFARKNFPGRNADVAGRRRERPDSLSAGRRNGLRADGGYGRRIPFLQVLSCRRGRRNPDAQVAGGAFPGSPLLPDRRHFTGDRALLSRAAERAVRGRLLADSGRCADHARLGSHPAACRESSNSAALDPSR